MGKIYFNQADPRWANHPYPSKNHPSATIKSGGCGATSAAMIVSSFKDIIYPNQMGDIFLNMGLRGLEGTLPQAFDFIAQKYDLKHEIKWKLDDAIACLKSGGMVVASCSTGLFTTGGHYIVLAGLKDDNTIIVYDPYLYKNKFNAYGRKGKAKVEGNNVYVTYTNFKEYGTYSRLDCYYSNTSKESSKETPQTMYVNTKSLNLNIRNTPGGTIIGSIEKGKQVTVYETKNGWARIGNNQWVSSSYLATKNTNTPTSKNAYVLGKYVTNVKSSLNVRNAPINGTIVKTYKNGTRFDTYEIKDNWARTPSGWVCLDFCNLIYKY